MHQSDASSPSWGKRSFSSSVPSSWVALPSSQTRIVHLDSVIECPIVLSSKVNVPKALTKLRMEARVAVAGLASDL